jgi:predicted membrane protein (TIGR00267 family)
MLRQWWTWLRITRSHLIARRYFVVNGFDGALTMLGLITGFAASGGVPLSSVIVACEGAALALGISGISSAYISETAEKESELRELERAMVADLAQSARGRAARVLPLVIALVNGIAPVVMSAAIIAPLWIAESGVPLPLAPLELSLVAAMFVIFLLGIYLGHVSGTFLLWAGLRALLIAAVTASLVFLVTRH